MADINETNINKSFNISLSKNNLIEKVRSKIFIGIGPSFDRAVKFTNIAFKNFAYILSLINRYTPLKGVVEDRKG